MYGREATTATWQIAVRDETGALMADLEDDVHVSVDGQAVSAEVTPREAGEYQVFLPVDDLSQGEYRVRISITDTRGITGWREWSVTKQGRSVYLPLILKTN